MNLLRLLKLIWSTLIYISFNHKNISLNVSFYSSPDNPIIQTNSGKIKGQLAETIYGDKYYYFDGVPYGQPPVGENRFKAPRPILKWSGIKDCTKQPNKSLQFNGRVNEVQGSEDCLYLSINVKKLHTHPKLPVMVYLHGGGFNGGDSTRRAWGPDYFMMKDVILISVGYRLGALGLTKFNDKSLEVPGNCALLDAVLALQWIQDNCLCFNGDPENITLFGHSSGSHMVHMLMQTPITKDLFHKAILLAGFHMDLFPHPKWQYRLAKKLGYAGQEDDEKSLCDFLSKMEASNLVNFDIFTEEEKQLFEIIKMYPCWPTMDDSIITQNPAIAQRSAWSNNIPLMMGSTSTEALAQYKKFHNNPETYEMFKKNPRLLLADNLKTLQDEQLIRKLCNKIKDIHFGDKEVTVANFQLALMNESYNMIYHNEHRLIQSRLKYASAPTYVYRFDFDSPYFNFYRQRFCGPDVRGVGHVDELGYIFLLPDAYKLEANTPEYQCIVQMIETFYSFAKNSDPNNRHLQPAHWEPVQHKSVPYCLNIGYDRTVFMPWPEYEKCCARDEVYKMTDIVLY
ncbi:esterase B1 [Musca vetustissima]|uniref:esterase B1 n=1 Tax=Musca vetustissima TaxID=27455 RepID=UPI002AB68D85|nr:esterase B1 [Musca vetustissima]